MRQRKKNKMQCFSELARRAEELERYGRLLSLRPSVAHESKKSYKRAVEKRRKFQEDW